MSGLSDIHTHTQPARPWLVAEYLLAALLIGSKILLLRMRWTAGMGFDAGAQLEAMERIAWLGGIGVRDTFYSYHPPMGFLLPKSLMLFGVSDVVSAQIVSFAAILAAFLFLRATLRRLALLHTSAGLALLYITFGLPMITFMGSSVNLDAIVFACGCAVLHWSIELFWGDDEPSRTTATMGIVVALSIALLTKFSAVVLLVLPALAAATSQRRASLVLRVESAGAVCMLALLIVSPYYLVRYYHGEGKLLVSNTDFLIPEAVEESKQTRDANPAAFVGTLFSSAPDEKQITETDYDAIRLWDAWRDFWVRNAFLGPSVPGGIMLGRAQLYASAWLLMLGAASVAMARWRRRRSPWLQLGGVLLPFSSLVIGALMFYLYQTPFAGWGPAKGIYIAPVALGIAYLIAAPLWSQDAGRRPQPPILLTSVLSAFLLVNHLLPVY